MSPLPPLPQSFRLKKTKILNQLSLPASEYDDLSPKGSIDESIKDLIDEINGREGLVTTSSCGGRVSVFLEGVKSLSDEGPGDRLSGGNGNGKSAGVGGKGGGGKWLFVSHERVDVGDVKNGGFVEFLGMKRCDGLSKVFGEGRLVHFKFEPMILHILTASLQHAQLVLTAAHQAGFRESGALNLTTTSTNEPPTPMVAVRTMGLSLESIIGSTSSETGESPVCIVSEEYLQLLVETSNTRFIENTKRIERFRELLSSLFSDVGKENVKIKADGSVWEDAVSRRERMRAEGLKRAEEARLRKSKQVGEESEVDETSVVQLNSIISPQNLNPS